MCRTFLAGSFGIREKRLISKFGEQPGSTPSPEHKPTKSTPENYEEEVLANVNDLMTRNLAELRRTQEVLNQPYFPQQTANQQYDVPNFRQMRLPRNQDMQRMQQSAQNSLYNPQNISDTVGDIATWRTQHYDYKPYKRGGQRHILPQKPRSIYRTRYDSKIGRYWQHYTGKGPDNGWEFGGIKETADSVRAKGKAFTARFEAEWARQHEPMSYEQAELLRNRMNPVRQERLRMKAKVRRIMGDEFFQDFPKRWVHESEIRYEEHRDRLRAEGRSIVDRGGSTYVERPKNSAEAQNNSISKSADTFATLVSSTFPEIKKEEIFAALRTLGRDFTQNSQRAKSGEIILDDPAGYLLRSIDDDASKISSLLQRARELQTEMNVSLTPFDREKVDYLYSLVTLAREPFALDVVRTLKMSGINMGFSFAPRQNMVLEQDRSSIQIVAEQLMQNGYATLSDPTLKQQMIVQIWNAVKMNQERAFVSGPDVQTSPEGKVESLKPIDVLVVTGGNNLEWHASQSEQLVQQMNSDPTQQRNGQPEGRSHILNTGRFRTLAELQSACKQAEMESRAQGHHLVVIAVLHGHTNGISMTFSDHKERVPFNYFAAPFDPSATSIFSSSCFSGAHAQSLRAQGIVLRNVHFNVQNMPNSLVPREFDHFVIKRAYAKNADGRMNADINADGHVTLGELKYWMDSTEILNDPSSFDEQGLRLTNDDRPQGDQLA